MFIKKILIVLLFLIMIFNSSSLYANEIIINNSLEVQSQKDYFDRYVSIAPSSSVYIKSFKLTNISETPIIIHKIETTSGFDNKKGYKELRTPYSSVFMDDLAISAFFYPYILRLPFDIIITPTRNFINKSKLMSIKKYETGKYKLKPHKSIVLVVVPQKWQPSFNDELTIQYKTIDKASKIYTFNYQFTYPDKIQYRMKK